MIEEFNIKSLEVVLDVLRQKKCVKKYVWQNYRQRGNPSVDERRHEQKRKGNSRKNEKDRQKTRK